MKKMMKRKSFAAMMFVLAMFVAAPVAFATTVTEVQALISSLKTKTTSVAITGKFADKDRALLISKLDDATVKVDRAKFCDAIAKLNDFKVKVNSLIADGQINQDPALGTTGTELLADADATIKAVNELQVQNTGAPCAL